MEKMHIKLNVNGKDVDLLTEPRTLLIHALREELGRAEAASLGGEQVGFL